MKMICPFLLLLFLGNSCNQERGIKTVLYAPVAEGKCSDNPANAYHYILPERHKGGLPLLIILDSGGDGLLAVKKTGPAVLQIPCIVIGSDLIRNNFPDYIQAIDVLINEAFRKFPVARGQVYLGGFSGGARMAFEYARQHTVKGVLMCGAGPGVSSFRELPCPVYMIAGTTDFNFAEMYYNPLKISEQRKFLTDYFRGSHEWPPAGLMKDGWLFLMAGSISGGGSLLEQESVSLVQKTDSLLAKDEILFALKSAEKALIFAPENKQAKKLMKKIRNDRKFDRFIIKTESDLALESRIDQAYAQASMVHDSIWWAKEIKQLSLEIANNEGDRKDHYLRIKGFLGILFYSRLNTLIHSQPGSNQIVHLLAAYKMSEPDNPDVYYDYAFFEHKQGNEQLSRKYLKVAISLGFKDYAKLEGDFPATVLNEVRKSFAF